MKDVLFSKNIKNSAWYLLDTFLYPVLFFVSSPWFISKLGEKEFGIWLLVNSIIITMQLFNLGLGAATFKNVALHAGLKNYRGVSTTINTNLSLSFVLQVFCIIMGVLLAMGIQFFGLFKIETAYIHMAAVGAVFGGAIVGLKFYEQLVGYTFKALEKFDIAAWINSGIRLTALLVNIILVYLGYGLTSLFTCSIIISVTGILISLVLLKKNIPGYSPSFHFRKDSIASEMNFAIWTWLQSLAIVITFQCDRFFVLTYIGLSTLAYYGLVATMFNHIHLGFSGIVPWLAPKVTRLKTQGNDVKELYLTSRNFCLLVALCLLLAFSIISGPLLKVLVNASTYHHIMGYIRLFTLFEVFFVYSIVPGSYLNAAGYEKLNFGIILLYCIIIITGMLTGYGLYKTATGMLAGSITATAVAVVLQHLVVEKRVLATNHRLASMIIFIPAIIIGGYILSDVLWLKLLLFLLSVCSLYVVFIRNKSINLNLVKHA